MPKPTLTGCYKMCEKFWTLPETGKSAGFFHICQFGETVIDRGCVVTKAEEGEAVTPTSTSMT